MSEARSQASNGGIVPPLAEPLTGPRLFTLEQQRDMYESLLEIEHLVRHEWRLKDHSPLIVLNSIEQVLDAL